MVQKVRLSLANALQIRLRMTSSSIDEAARTIPAMIENQRNDIAQLCERFGVVELALFGSILRTDFD
jgi:hypothetical protein